MPEEKDDQTIHIVKNVGETVKRLRKKQMPFMSQTELAEKADVSLPTISNIESGSTSVNNDTLMKVFRALGVDVAELCFAVIEKKSRITKEKKKRF